MEFSACACESEWLDGTLASLNIKRYRTQQNPPTRGHFPTTKHDRSQPKGEEDVIICRSSTVIPSVVEGQGAGRQQPDFQGTGTY